MSSGPTAATTHADRTPDAAEPQRMVATTGQAMDEAPPESPAPIVNGTPVLRDGAMTGVAGAGPAA